jgi:hypothetical protein
MILVLASTAALFFCFPATANAFSKAQRQSFQHSITDYRKLLNPRYRKAIRKKTKYIIVHTSEADLETTLKIVSRGKQTRGNWFTFGGHTHYVIARDGRTFRILDKKYIADHAGRSMWNGETDISTISIGIELVGYHDRKLTDQQYRSVGLLIDILQGVYRLNDRAVLAHSQVAYGRPNRWIGKRHRGRKQCARNFIRYKAELGPTWPFDPDVKAGRLIPDRELATVYYHRNEDNIMEADLKILKKNQTAWSVAGKDYNKKTTIYFLPSGSVKKGSQISRWHKLPPRTKIIVGYCGPYRIDSKKPPIKIAGQNYNDKGSIYYFSNKKLVSGDKIENFRRLPSNVFLFLPVKRTLGTNFLSDDYSTD